MKLFDHAVSPYAFKVRTTPYEKGIEFESVEMRSAGQRAELLRLDPRGEVPTLQDGDAVVYDAMVICEYLEERHPAPPLLPADPVARARCRALEVVSDTQLGGCVFALGLYETFRPNLPSDFPELPARVRAPVPAALRQPRAGARGPRVPGRYALPRGPGGLPTPGHRGLSRRAGARPLPAPRGVGRPDERPEELAADPAFFSPVAWRRARRQGSGATPNSRACR